MSARRQWHQWTPRQALGTAGRPRRRLLRRLLICLVVAVIGLLGLGVGGIWWATDHYGDQVTRIPHAFPDGPRPESSDGNTFLLAGVDSRSARPTTGDDATADLWKVGAQRSDTLMLVHLDTGKHASYTVSIPRDSWVPIPGRGSAKINAAFSWGGPPLLIQTVEQLTGVRIDHFAVIDWHGFRSLTDAVGGVPITVRENSYDPQQGRHFKAGTRTMNGEEALSYVRQRHGLPGGELDRIKRQQQFLRALVGEIRGDVSITNPLKVDRMLEAITGTVSVDDRLSNSDLRDLVFGLRRLESADAYFTTAPIVRSDLINGQYVLILDRESLRRLCLAVVTGHPLGIGK
ncbi:LCP family protein [Streptomyces sp. ME02-8801-2C]|uniref:LCP family protein n=1 Tax=Streptomyces sp. ME02-8801-2C TaxID=3028680 RepID=UPI0029BEA2E8|nr:LCP family protein [Streptomyces sp. ME02-8801-2C]MDX3451809.1 LCP family protein [Streptomyces sp. ME02-8801-2C]